MDVNARDVVPIPRPRKDALQKVRKDVLPRVEKDKVPLAVFFFK